MAEIASAFISIIPSAKGFGKKLQSEAGRETNGVGKKLGTGFGKAFGAAAGLLAAAGIGALLKGSIDEAREAQKVGAATEAILKATGNAAKLSAGQISDLAGALSAKTGIDDEAIQAGENLLLTFKNVKKEGSGLSDIFGRATKAGLDLAAAGFGSIEGNAVQLGKALNDPTKGIAALAKSGVTFTEGQKEQIKGFVKSNDLLSAQKIILGEIEHQVGGTAEATATAGEKAAVAYGNLKEQLGTALLPVVDALASKFVALAPAIGKTIDGIGGVAAILTRGDFAGAAKTFGFTEDSKQVAFLFAVRGALIKLGSVAKYVGGIIKDQLEVRFHLLGDALSFLQPIFDRVGKFLRDNPKTVKVFAATLATLVGVIGAITVATTLFSIALNSTGIPLVIIGIAALAAGLYYAYQNSETFRNIVDQVAASLKQFAVYVKTQVIPFLAELATTVGTKLKPILTQLAVTFKTTVLPTITQAVAKFREMQPALQRIFAAAGQVVGVIIRLAAKFVVVYATIYGKVIPVLIQIAGFILSKAVPAITAYIGAVVGIIDKMISFARKVGQAASAVVRFASTVKTKLTDALNTVQGFPDRIVSILSGLANDLYNVGKNAAAKLGQGIIDGINDKIHDVQRSANRIANAIKDKFPGSPVKSGPLKSWNHGGGVSGAGRKLGQGIADGILAKRKAVIAAITKVADGIKATIDKIKSQISSVKDTMRTLASSVADAFKPDLFGGNLADLFTNGSKGTLNLKRLKAAFLKLRKFGLSPKFLSGLFASGNTDLILQLAESGKSSARSAQSLFNQTNSLSGQLGNAVGTNQFGDELRGLRGDLRDEMQKLRLEVAKMPKALGKEINGAATNGRRKTRV